MKMGNVLVKVVGLGLLLAAQASMAQIVVSPSDTEAWVSRNSNTGTLQLGIADNNGGADSLELSTDGTDGQVVKAARIPLPPFLAITVGAVTSVSWEFYTDNASNYPRPQLEYFSLSLGGGTLVYESGNLSPTLNTWQSASVNFGSDLFRDTQTNTVDTLTNFQALYGSALMNYFQFGYGSTGGSFPATMAYLDYPELNGTTWDFEGVAVLPAEPAPAPAQVPTLSVYGLALTVLGLLMVVRRRLRR